MRVIDLTHTMNPDMPVFPGTEPPVFQPANTLGKDGFEEKKITMYSHTGTHMDAPSHMLKDGLPLDKQNIDHFIGNAIVLDLTSVQENYISVQDLLRYKDHIKLVEFVIIKTGWSKYWGDEKYFRNFPSLTKDAADWLSTFELKGIGIDTISIDSMDSTTFKIHHIFFKRNINVIENLTNLDAIEKEIFIFSCMPLKVYNADGSPTRAIAIERE